MAPELVAACSPVVHMNGAKADVYSYGVILGEILTQEKPWHHLKRKFKLENAVTAGPCRVVFLVCGDRRSR